MRKADVHVGPRCFWYGKREGHRVARNHAVVVKKTMWAKCKVEFADGITMNVFYTSLSLNG